MTGISTSEHITDLPLIPLASLQDLHLKDLHVHAFAAAAEARCMWLVSADSNHILVDCNDVWCAQMGFRKCDVLQFRMQDIFRPQGLLHLQDGLDLVQTIKFGVIMIRNTPVNTSGLVVDVVVWPEYDTQAQEAIASDIQATHTSEQAPLYHPRAAKSPNYLQMLYLNPRIDQPYSTPVMY